MAASLLHGWLCDVRRATRALPHGDWPRAHGMDGGLLRTNVQRSPSDSQPGTVSPMTGTPGYLERSARTESRRMLHVPWPLRSCYSQLFDVGRRNAVNIGDVKLWCECKRRSSRHVAIRCAGEVFVEGQMRPLCAWAHAQSGQGPPVCDASSLQGDSRHDRRQARSGGLTGERREPPCALRAAERIRKPDLLC